MSLEIDREHRTFSMTKTVPPNMTLDAMRLWMLANDLNPETAFFTGGHDRYDHTETDQERDLRVTHAEKANAQHVEWVRRRYHDLGLEESDGKSH